MTEKYQLNPVFDFMEQQKRDSEAKLLEQVQEHWAKHGAIADTDTLKLVAFRDPNSLQKFLSIHPASSIVNGLADVKRAFDILALSRQAFIEIVGRFHGQILHNYDYDGLFGDVSRQATKEVYTYSVAAESLVQSYRHLVSVAPKVEANYEALKKEVFGIDGIFAFIKELRVANCHVGVVTANPHYEVSFGQEKKVVSGIAFDRTEFLGIKDLNKKVQAFVTNLDDLQIVDLINRHFKLAKKFFELVPHRTGILTSVEFRDYEKIRLANKIYSSVVSLQLVLPQSNSKTLNPYEYLDKYFSKAEIDNIYWFKNHSKAQVDYMINLRDPIGLVDTHLRSRLYELFQVPNEEFNRSPLM